MIEQLQVFLKDPAKMARAATIGFFVMVVLVTWFLVTLPYNLVYDGGMIDSGRATTVYAKLFAAIALAFGFCYALIYYMQRAKRETIVYLDKKISTGESQQGSSAGQSDGSVNLDALRQKVQSAKAEEKLQIGLNELCAELNAGQGALYTITKKGENKTIDLKHGYALMLAEEEPNPSFLWGEGLIGQVAASGSSVYLDEMPEGYASRIESGLGSALPKFLFIFPLRKENETVGVVEVATFTNLLESQRKQAEGAGNILSEIC